MTPDQEQHVASMVYSAIYHILQQAVAEPEALPERFYALAHEYSKSVARSVRTITDP